MAISKISESRFSNGLKKYSSFYDGVTFQEVKSGLVLKLDAGDQSSYGGVNHLLYSEQFGNTTGWNTTSYPVSVTSNAAIAPDGTLTADLVVGNNPGTTLIFTNVSTDIAFASLGSSFIATVYAKAASSNYFTFNPYWGGESETNLDFYLDGSNVIGGSPGNATSYSIESVGNGWYKCQITIPRIGSATSSTFRIWPSGRSYNGTGIYLWGAQMRPTTATSSAYVRTTSTTATSASGYWYDMSGNGAHATFQNSPSWSSLNGGYFSFNGSNQRATSSLSVITGNTPRTSCVWVTGNANDRIPLSLGNTANANEAFSIVPQTGGTVNSYGLTGTYDESGLSTGGVNLLDGNWHYVALSYDSNYTGVLRLYVDGNFASSLTRTASKAYATSSGYQVGNWGNNDRYWSGNIAQVSVYNRILSEAEIKNNFNYYRRRFGV
jgi:hypothetical protein